MNDIELFGRCLCGAVHYRIAGAIRNRCYCHCESCRRASGAPVVAWGTVDRVAFQLSKGALAIHHSSPNVERGFCSTCGTTLTYAHAERADEIDFTLSSLADPSRAAPEMHIWLRDKLPWLVLGDTLPRHETVTPE